MNVLRSIRLFGLLLATTALPFVYQETSADDQVKAFVIGKLWPGNADPIPNAVMLVSDGKVQAVGPSTKVKVPADAERHDLPNAVVVPGFVIAETSIGIATDDERTLTPEVRAIDGFDLFADYSDFVAAGVTTVQIAPGRQRLMPGQSAVVKLAGTDHSRRIVSPQESLRIILSKDSANAPRIYEPPVGAVSVDNPLDPTRPQVSESLAARIAGLRAIFEAAQSGEVDPDGIVDFDAIREALAAGRLQIKANTDAEIRAAFRLFAELQKANDRKLSLTLADPNQLDAFVNEIKKLKDIGFVLNAGVRPGQVSNPSVPKDDDPTSQKPWEVAQSLLESGASDFVAIRPASDSDLDKILFLAGLFTRSGASTSDVLKMVTANPAKILGVSERVGSLQVGRDADFVVLTDDPFQSDTLVQSTWVDGESVYERNVANQVTVIEAGSVYTSAKDSVLNGRIVVGNKKIQAIGSSVSLPEDAEIKRYPKAVVVPGFLDLGTGLGFGGSISRVTISTKLGDRLASDDPAMAFARQGGITTAVFASSTSPSPMLAFKLSDTPRLLKDPVGIRFSMPTNLTTGIPSLKKTLTTAKAYADSWKKYEAESKAYESKLKEYKAALAKYEAANKALEAKQTAEKKKEEAEKTKSEADKPKEENPNSDESSKEKPDSESKDKDKNEAAEKKEDDSAKKTDLKPPTKPTEPKKPKSSSTYEAYRSLMAKQIPAFVSAKSVKSITAAVKLFREDFDLPMVLIDAEDCYRVPNLLAKHEVKVSLGPNLVRKVDNSTVNLPQVMANHQIPFAFQSNATTGVQQLPLAVQYSVYRGLGTADALTGLSESAARLLSLDQTIGSLEAGKDADLVVLSGPPFEPSSQVLAVMIDGAWVYERGAKQ